MKRLFLSSLVCLLFLSACKKDKDKDDVSSGDASVEATLNGVKTKFTIEGATLLRSNEYEAKRVDITCLSEDKKLRLILTIGNNGVTGDGMLVKSYAINIFNDVEPTESNEEALLVHSTKLDGGGWLTGVWETTGSLTVTANNSSAKTISGIFAAELINLNNSEEKMSIKDGKFINVKYMVMN